MTFHEDEEKDPSALSDEVISEALDEDADEDEVASVPLEDDEKAWE